MTEVKQQKIDKEDVSAAHADSSDGETGSKASLSRNEKKVLRQLQKIGLEELTGCQRVEMRVSKQRQAYHYTISKPRIFKVPGNVPSYIILGQVRVGDMREELARQAKLFAAQQQQHQQNKAAAGVSDSADAAAANVESSGVKVEEVVDTSGLDENDINLGMEQTGKSKAEVVEALRKFDGDIIEAIMQLTS